MSFPNSVCKNLSGGGLEGTCVRGLVDQGTKLFRELAVAALGLVRRYLHSDGIELRLVSFGEQGNQRFDLVGAWHGLTTYIRG